MNKNKFEKFIEKTIKDLVRESYLVDYQIYYNIHKTSHKNDEYNNEETDSTIEVDDTYLNATINIYPPVKEYYDKKNYVKVREILAHEIAHIRVHPLAVLAKNRFVDNDEIIKEYEKLTETIGRLIYQVTYDKK